MSTRQDELRIETARANGRTQLKIAGRIDSYWSDELNKAIEAEIHDGNYHIELDLRDVNFISSAGIRVVIIHYKKLKGLNGSFKLTALSDIVQNVLEMSGLGALLTDNEGHKEGEGQDKSRLHQYSGHIFDVAVLNKGASMTCKLSGAPSLLPDAYYSDSNMMSAQLDTDALALGIGAIGEGYEDCKGRFGDFMSVAGASAYLPTDGTRKPDYSLKTGSLVPQVHYLYSIICRGGFKYYAEFSPSEGSGPIGHDELMMAALDISGADTIAVATLAETEYLVGAYLLRSPVNGKSMFQFPEIRDAIDYTTEAAWPGMMSIVVSVVSRDLGFKEFARPLGIDESIYCHSHAAVFPFMPVKKGDSDLAGIVNTLFDGSRLKSVMHLINDNREMAGTGQSELRKGMCWIAPIDSITNQKGDK